jgi:hypothetical protein
LIDIDIDLDFDIIIWYVRLRLGNIQERVIMGYLPKRNIMNSQTPIPNAEIANEGV